MIAFARSLPCCFAAALGVAAAHAQSLASAKFVAAQSEIAFQIKQSGVPVDGKFRRFDAQLALDPKAPWFNAAKFPRATFQSNAISALGGGRFQAKGRFELKGTAHDIVVPVTIVQNGPQSAATGEFVVKRLDYKIGENEWTDVSLVANDVRVRFKLVFTGLNPL